MIFQIEHVRASNINVYFKIPPVKTLPNYNRNIITSSSSVMSFLNSLRATGQTSTKTLQCASKTNSVTPMIATRTIPPIREYKYPTTINWYPGHMVKAQRMLKDTFLPRAHMILEIRDARVPISSINPHIEQLIKGRQRLLVFNKADLLTKSQKNKLFNYIKHEYPASNIDGNNTNTNTNTNINNSSGEEKHCTTNRSTMKNSNIRAVLGDSRSHFASRRVSSVLKEMAFSNRKYKALPVVIAIMGYPNVGKSTLINSLRVLHGLRGSATVGKTAGITRHIAAFKISNIPLIHILDTPGIFLPALKLGNSKDSQIGMKLSLCGMVKDSAAGILEIADYCLYRLNKTKNINTIAKYKQLCGFNHNDEIDGDYYCNESDTVKICNDIEELMYCLGEKEGYYYQHFDPVAKMSYQSDEIDIHRAAKVFVEWYRKGILDKNILDVLPNYEKNLTTDQIVDSEFSQTQSLNESDIGLNLSTINNPIDKEEMLIY